MALGGRHSFLAPVSRPREQPSARQLAGESRAALVNLEAILKQRNQTLEQRIERQEHEKTREKQNFEQNLQNERQNFANKREHLWGEIDRARMDLARKNEAINQLKRRLREQQRKCDEERQRADALEQQNRDLREDLADIINKYKLEMIESKTKQEQLQRKMKQMEKTHHVGQTELEQERSGWQQRNTTSNNQGVKSSLEWAIPHLRGLLDAYDREQGRENVDSHQAHAAPATMTIATITQNEDGTATRCVTEQQGALDHERPLLMLQARTQKGIRRHNIEPACPISMEVLDEPIVTTCCGKTFSSSGLRQALQRSSRCPFCNEPRVSFYPNRDVAKLVEPHQAEHSVLELTEMPIPSPALARGDDGAAIEQRQSASANRTHHSQSSSNRTRRSRHRDHRSERVRARSDVPHRQPLRLHAQTAGSHHQEQPSTSGYTHRASPRVTEAGRPEGDIPTGTSAVTARRCYTGRSHLDP